MDALEMTHQLREIVQCARFIYGENWKERAAGFRIELAKYQAEHGKKSLLGAAIDFVKDKDEKVQMAYLAAAADPQLENIS